MKVINLKKQQKNSRFCSFVLFTKVTKPHEKPWKGKHSSHFFVSQHFFLELRMRPKVHSSWPANRRRIWFFICCCNTSRTNLNFKENRSSLSPMTAKICFKIENHGSTISNQLNFQSEIDKHWSHQLYLTSIFSNFHQLARLKVCLKMVLNCIALVIQLINIMTMAVIMMSKSYKKIIIIHGI